MVINKDSVYIRKNYTESTQEVNTAINFNSPIVCLNALQDNQPITLQQCNARQTLIKNEVLDAVTDVKPITSAKLTLFQVANSFIGNQNYGGMGNMVFITEDSKPLFAVAWSWTSQGASKYPAYENWNVWLAKEPIPKPLYEMRIIADPDNLTQEDLDYLAQYGNTMRVKGFLGSLYTSNLADWSSLAGFFKGIWSKSLSSSSNINIGVICNSPLNMFAQMELDTTSPLFSEIVALEACVLNVYQNWSYQYGVPNFFMEWSLNNRNVVSHFIQFTKAEVVTAQKPYFYTPLFRSESYNDLFFENNQGYSLNSDQWFCKAVYDATTDSFTYVRP